MVAVEQDGRNLTYHELEKAANGLANRLIAMGLEPGQRVCLVVQRSLPMTIAMLAVLKAGCQYVPLDGQVTAETALRHILQDTKAPFVLCLEKFYRRVQQLAKPNTQILVLDNSLEKPQLSTRPGLSVDHSDGAYTIYTSGKLSYIIWELFLTMVQVAQALLKEWMYRMETSQISFAIFQEI